MQLIKLKSNRFILIYSFSVKLCIKYSLSLHIDARMPTQNYQNH